MCQLIACSTAFDGYGDYNQTRKLILILNIYFFIKYFEDFKTINKKYLWLILLGITLGLQVICVQTGIAIIATYYIVLLWYYLTHKKGFKDLLILTVSL